MTTFRKGLAVNFFDINNGSTYTVPSGRYAEVELFGNFSGATLSRSGLTSVPISSPSGRTFFRLSAGDSVNAPLARGCAVEFDEP